MSGHDCEACPVAAELAPMGVQVGGVDRVVALAGNPNTGKSTLFNALTGLRQHTGNWPGKTVTRAEGGFEFDNVRYKLVDLPGTYSLLSASQDEEVARDFMLFGQPDARSSWSDATALERNLNLALQVLEITDRVVVAVNLMDEARRKGIDVDTRSLARDLGVPVDRRSSRAPAKACTRCSTAVDGVSSRRHARRPAAARHGHAGVRARRARTGAADRGRSARGAQRALDRHSPARRRRPRSKRRCAAGELARLVARQQQRDARFSQTDRPAGGAVRMPNAGNAGNPGTAIMTTDTRSPSPDAVLARARELRAS